MDQVFEEVIDEDGVKIRKSMEKLQNYRRELAQRTSSLSSTDSDVVITDYVPAPPKEVKSKEDNSQDAKLSSSVSVVNATDACSDGTSITKALKMTERQLLKETAKSLISPIHTPKLSPEAFSKEGTERVIGISKSKVSVDQKPEIVKPKDASLKVRIPKPISTTKPSVPSSAKAEPHTKTSGLKSFPSKKFSVSIKSTEKHSQLVRDNASTNSKSDPTKAKSPSTASSSKPLSAAANLQTEATVSLFDRLSSSSPVKQQQKSPARNVNNYSPNCNDVFADAISPENVGLPEVNRKHKIPICQKLESVKTKKPSISSEVDDPSDGIIAKLRQKLVHKDDRIRFLEKQLAVFKNQQSSSDNRTGDGKGSETGNHQSTGLSKVERGCQCQLVESTNKESNLQKNSEQYSVIEQLNEDVCGRNKKISQLEDDMKQSTSKCEEMSKLTDELRKELSESEKKLASAKNQCDSLKNEVTGLHSAVSKLVRDLKDRDEQLLVAKKDNERLNRVAAETPPADLSENVPQLESSTLSLEECCKKLTFVQQELAVARRECIDRGEIIDELNRSRDRSQAVSASDDELIEAMTKNDILEKEVAFLMGKRVELEYENEHLKQQVENLKSEVIRLVIDRDLPAKLVECVSKNRIDNLHHQLDRLKQKIPSDSISVLNVEDT